VTLLLAPLFFIREILDLESLRPPEESNDPCGGPRAMSGIAGSWCLEAPSEKKLLNTIKHLHGVIAANATRIRSKPQPVERELLVHDTARASVLTSRLSRANRLGKVDTRKRRN
jgi:hypothetical protein